MQIRPVLVLGFLGTSASLALAQTPDTQATPSVNDTTKAPIGAFYLQYLDYEQRVHSTSESTELGEKTKLDAAFQYNFDADTNIRLRLDIDPYKYPEENKTSKFEVRLHHRYENLEVQADFDVNGDDYGRGATTFGLDDDSKDSFLAYRFGTFSRAVFYPYNFGGEVGQEFRTLDVTRNYYIDGTPTVINEIPKDDEKLRLRTVPGFEWQFFPKDNLMAYVGIGSVSFNYPADPGFDIKTQTASSVWKIKEDRAYKTGLRYTHGQGYVLAEAVTHTNSDLTGSLLRSAASLQAQQSFGPTQLSFEHTVTKAGARAYRLNKDGSWFANDRGYNPIFVDYYRAEQDWLGKTDSASMLKVAYTSGKIVPYLAFKTIGANFLFRKRESAEKLRTVDETQSHGGLKSLKFGAEIKEGRFTVRPEVESFLAKNAVYGNRADLQEFSINNKSYGKKNTVFTLNTSYQY